MKFVGIHSYIFANIKQYRYICNDLTSISQKKGVYMKSLNHSDLYNDSTTEKKMYNKKENVNNLQGKKVETTDKKPLGGEIWYT